LRCGFLTVEDLLQSYLNVEISRLMELMEREYLHAAHNACGAFFTTAVALNGRVLTPFPSTFCVIVTLIVEEIC
jgi:hypothetical protein